MKRVELNLAVARERVGALRVGQHVTVSGRMYAGRGTVLSALGEAGLGQGNDEPLTIYHAAPLVTGREGAWTVSSAGPSVSYRNEAALARLVRTLSVTVVIGQGSLGDAMCEACAEKSSVYIQAVGGAGTVTASRAQSVECLNVKGHDDDPIWIIEIEGFEAIVSIDSRGRSLYRRARTRALKNHRQLLKERL